MKTKFTIFCFAFTVCANIHTVNAQVNVQDSLALVDLYNSTDGPNWINHKNWLTANLVSTWYGVTADTRVKIIQLTKNRLKGSIPFSIGNLANLQDLFLSINQLSGTIPYTISSLTNLLTSDLRSNNFN